MKKILLKPNISIRQAMKALDRAQEKCLIVVDENNKLLGTLTDGDLRRSILSGSHFSEDISKSYYTNPITLNKKKFSPEVAKKLLSQKSLDLIPVLDENQKVVDYVSWSRISDEDQVKKSLSNVSVVIMAGGRGSRLEPFTRVLPKSLVPVNEKPIIEHIIERFTKHGCNDFHVTVNYKGKILKAFFEEIQYEYCFNFVEEQEPLGTAGSLRLLDGKFDKPFFVTNCDIIIKSDYKSLYEFHNKGSFDVTLVASTKEYIIPYGTCELNPEGHLSHIDEKPRYEFLINTGLYILNPDLLKLIPENKFYHITHLIEEAKNCGKKVGVFPIDEDAWIDVGQWAEYRQAVERL